MEHTKETKARHKAIRDALRNRPGPEELIASGECAQPTSQGVVLDTMMEEYWKTRAEIWQWRAFFMAAMAGLLAVLGFLGWLK